MPRSLTLACWFVFALVCAAAFGAAPAGAWKVAVVTDIEGDILEAQRVGPLVCAADPDLIVVAGDLYENEARRKHPFFPESTDNLKETLDGLEPFVACGVPIYVIPGNHETRAIYEQALAVLAEQGRDVRDLHRRFVDLDGLNLVGLGGYYVARRTPEDGFPLAAEDYAEARELLRQAQSQNEPLLFVTHSPPRTDTKLDFVEGAGNVGDPELAAIGREFAVINVCGHIHEGGGQAALGPSLLVNAASITRYNNPDGQRGVLIDFENGETRMTPLR